MGPSAIRHSVRKASMICIISTSVCLSRSFSFQQSQQIKVKDHKFYEKMMLLLSMLKSMVKKDFQKAGITVTDALSIEYLIIMHDKYKYNPLDKDDL